MKILVINLMHLGDLLLVTPALRTLRKNFPAAHITMLADKKLADMIQYNKNIDECLLIDKKGTDNHLINFLKLIFKLRSKNFDLVINFHRNERASALAAFSGGKKIVGYSKRFFSMFFTKVLPNQKSVKHQIHSHLEVLQNACGIKKVFDNGLELWIPKKIEHQAEKIFNENFPNNLKVIAFNIGASWLTKRWIDSYFAQCADILLERGYGVAFLGGTMDKEIVHKCVGKMCHRNHKNLKIFTGNFSLGLLAGFLDNCVLFLTTDSGPMHVGVARNIPIITMFGASPVPGFYPYDSKDILIKTPEICHPCGKHVCPRDNKNNLACMKHIPVKVVMKYTLELLEKYNSSAKNLPRAPGQYKCRIVDLSESKN